MVKLYSEKFERKYYSRKCSWTHFFYICIVFSFILLPFILSFATNNFWKPTTLYYGKANAKFTNEVFIQAEVGGVLRSYSNIQVLNQNIRNRINGPIFKAYADDGDDYNRVYDDFQFNFAFKSGGSSVTSIAIFLHFTYFVEQTLDTSIKGIVPIFISSPSGSSISKAYLSGQLLLDQKVPLNIGDGLDGTLYNYNFTEEMESYSIEKIYTRFTNRNSTFTYDHTATILPFGDSDTTEVQINMNIPDYAPILYYPGFLECLKLAWVQYFALLVPAYLILFLGLFATSIETGIFSTVTTNDCSSSLKFKPK